MGMKFFSFYVVLLLVAASSGMRINGQSVSCLNQLAPCLNYLNGTKEVPQVCCNPLKSVIRNNPECLCRMISNRGSSQAERAGIDVNDAQMLPARCGEHVNPIACLTRTHSNLSSFFFFQSKDVSWIFCVLAGSRGGSTNSDRSSSIGNTFSQSYWMTTLAIAATVLSYCHHIISWISHCL